jgi:hypothetical protein
MNETKDIELQSEQVRNIIGRCSNFLRKNQYF